MEAEIKNIIKRYGLLESVSIVAVSGGLDSVVLLDLLARFLAPANLIVAHVDHGLRRASAGEAKLVRSLAERYGLQYLEERLKLKERDEATAREGRYRWLRKIKEKHQASYIITAHHLDDQLETIIMNLVRGVGPFELWGMKELQGDIMRPLLSVPKEELRQYAAKHRLAYCEDESNRDIKYTRNRIRHTVIPALKEINPLLTRVVNREIALGREAQDYLEQLIKNSERRVVNSNSINLERFKRLHPYLQKELIKRMLQRVTGREADIYQKNVGAVMEILTKNGTKVTELRGVRVEKTYRSLIFGAERTQGPKSKKLKLGEEVEFNGFVLTLKAGSRARGKNKLLLPVGFSDNLRVRTWRSGDKIKASFGTKKIQDVFTDAKIDRRDRQRWPIVVHDREVIWVPGLLAAKLDGDDKKLIVEVK